MHRALVLVVVTACVTRHYVTDPHTVAGQQTTTCMDDCTSLLGECPDRCHVEVREECRELAPGLECKATHELHWSLQALIVAGVAVLAVGGVVSFIYAE